jgi:hypothetical protein
MRRRRADRAGPALVFEPQGAPMRVRRLSGRIAEEVVGEAQEGAQAID